ncbi:MAG: hypothetical protein WCA08_18610 [Desulfoferrobacter sp.]
MTNKCASIILVALVFALASGESISHSGDIESSDYGFKALWGNISTTRSQVFADPSTDLLSRSFRHLDQSMDSASADIYGNNLALGFKTYFSIISNHEWNLVGRPVLPFPANGQLMNKFEESEKSYGLGDMTFVALLSPAKPSGSFVWGLGSAITLPTATENEYGAGKWQLGPTAAGFYLGDNWIFGILSQHRWVFAGDGDRPNVSQTIMQYFLEYNLSDRLDLGVAHHIMVNWNTERGYASPFPFDLNEARTFSVGKLPVKFLIDGFFEVSANWKF